MSYPAVSEKTVYGFHSSILGKNIKSFVLPVPNTSNPPKKVLKYQLFVCSFKHCFTEPNTWNRIQFMERLFFLNDTNWFEIYWQIWPNWSGVMKDLISREDWFKLREKGCLYWYDRYLFMDLLQWRSFSKTLHYQ